MWWIYSNAGQLLTLLVGASSLPHYTVAFKPLFEFIVLGIIPGTSFSIGYMSSLIIALILMLLLLVVSVKQANARQAQHKDISLIAL